MSPQGTVLSSRIITSLCDWGKKVEAPDEFNKAHSIQEEQAPNSVLAQTDQTITLDRKNKKQRSKALPLYTPTPTSFHPPPRLGRCNANRLFSERTVCAIPRNPPKYAYNRELTPKKTKPEKEGCMCEENKNKKRRRATLANVQYFPCLRPCTSCVHKIVPALPNNTSSLLSCTAQRSPVPVAPRLPARPPRVLSPDVACDGWQRSWHCNWEAHARPHVSFFLSFI